MRQQLISISFTGSIQSELYPPTINSISDSFAIKQKLIELIKSEHRLQYWSAFQDFIKAKIDRRKLNKMWVGSQILIDLVISSLSSSERYLSWVIKLTCCYFLSFCLCLLRTVELHDSFVLSILHNTTTPESPSINTPGRPNLYTTGQGWYERKQVKFPKRKKKKKTSSSKPDRSSRNDIHSLQVYDLTSGPFSSSIVPRLYVMSTRSNVFRTETISRFWHAQGPNVVDRIWFCSWSGRPVCNIIVSHRFRSSSQDNLEIYFHCFNQTDQLFTYKFIHLQGSQPSSTTY
jgi:hypothetical protein